MLNEKGVITQLIIEERLFLTGSFPTVFKVQRLFNFHKYDWMAQDLDSYSDEIVREFYASYIGTLWGSVDKRERHVK